MKTWINDFGDIPRWYWLICPRGACDYWRPERYRRRERVGMILALAAGLGAI